MNQINLIEELTKINNNLDYISDLSNNAENLKGITNNLIEILSSIDSTFNENQIALKTDKFTEECIRFYNDIHHKVEDLENIYDRYYNLNATLKDSLKSSIVNEQISLKTVEEISKHISNNISNFNKHISESRQLQSNLNSFIDSQGDIKSLLKSIEVKINEVNSAYTDVDLDTISNRLGGLVDKITTQSLKVKEINDLVKNINMISGKEIDMVKNNLSKLNSTFNDNIVYIKKTTLGLTNYLKEEFLEEISQLREELEALQKDKEAISNNLLEIKKLINDKIVPTTHENQKNTYEMYSSLKEENGILKKQLYEIINQNKEIIAFAKEIQEENKSYKEIFSEIFSEWSKNNIRSFALKSK